MISKILILVGGMLMVAGTFRAIMEKRVAMRLHWISVSDVSGAMLVLTGILLTGFEVWKVVLSMIFIGIWSPLVSHTIAKAIVKRLKR